MRFPARIIAQDRNKTVAYKLKSAWSLLVDFPLFLCMYAAQFHGQKQRNKTIGDPNENISNVHVKKCPVINLRSNWRPAIFPPNCFSVVVVFIYKYHHLRFLDTKFESFDQICSLFLSHFVELLSRKPLFENISKCPLISWKFGWENIFL